MQAKIRETEIVNRQLTRSVKEMQAEIEHNAQDLNKEKATNSTLEHKLSSLTENTVQSFSTTSTRASADGGGAEHSRRWSAISRIATNKVEGRLRGS